MSQAPPTKLSEDMILSFSMMEIYAEYIGMAAPFTSEWKERNTGTTWYWRVVAPMEGVIMTDLNAIQDINPAYTSPENKARLYNERSE